MYKYVRYMCKNDYLYHNIIYLKITYGIHNDVRSHMNILHNCKFQQYCDVQNLSHIQGVTEVVRLLDIGKSQ